MKKNHGMNITQHDKTELSGVDAREPPNFRQFGCWTQMVAPKLTRTGVVATFPQGKLTLVQTTGVAKSLQGILPVSCNSKLTNGMSSNLNCINTQYAFVHKKPTPFVPFCHSSPIVFCVWNP